MNALAHAAAYLHIPDDYAESLGIRWSRGRDAIERHDESVLAFSEELRSILDGVFAGPQVPPFAFVLALLDAMKRDGLPAMLPLRRAFEETRGGVGRRNVGLLIAELCRELPPVAGELAESEVAQALLSMRLYGNIHRSELIERPALTREEFDRRIAARLTKFTHEDLRHWLTHGTGPSHAGGPLAAETESLPARVARLLMLARKRQRLVGAAVLVPALDAGLTLPPRRRSTEAPPQGGYCDVTTRGEPERLLPSQFALDTDEFIRRFAANELLYFQRETPHQPELPERIIVLDQGVRTWGSVRLALAAAAFSLLVPRAKRCASVRLFLSSSRGPLDINGQDVEAVAEQLESSDLTADPSLSLWHAMHDTSAGTAPRDIILLTHPRSVRSLTIPPDMSPRPNDRLFALSVDERGKAELGEWLRSGFTAIRSFRVDLEAAENAKPESEATPQPNLGAAGEWTGDIEPVPFPFRPGLIAEPQAFGFDADGEWLVIVGQNGILQGLAFDGSAAEVLPRAFCDGVILDQVDAVLSVTCGVVICGRMDLKLHSLQQVAVHYDRTTRSVTRHVLGPAISNAQWAAYPDLHCISVRTETVTGCALDLATNGRYPVSPPNGLVSRARAAWDRSAKGSVSACSLPVLTATTAPTPGEGRPHLLVLADTLQVWHAMPPWKSACEPQSDGKPLLEGATIHSAQLSGDILALSMLNAGQRKLVLLRGPAGVILGEVTHSLRYAYSLSPDGNLLARRDAMRSVVVSRTNDPSRPVATAPHAALHNALDVRLDAEPFRLTIAIGTFAHTFRLLNGELRYSLALGWDNFPEPKVPLAAQQRSPITYDDGRFPGSEGAASGSWRTVLDRLGQVLLFANDEFVAAFVVRRERAAAWIPGGVFWGTPALIGGPATPDAEKKIGRVIQMAGG